MKIFFTLFLSGIVSVCMGQQLTQYSLYMLNPYSINPAYAGMENTLIATGVYRQQWSGLKGAPLSQQVNAHLPLYKFNSGLGLRVENNAIGAHRTTSAYLTYSYHLELGRSAILSVGASGGYLQYSLDGDKLRAPQGTYAEPGGVFDHNDPYLPEGKVTAGTPVGEAGIYLKIKKWSIGAAVQPILAPTLSTTKSGGFRLTPNRHYLMTATYAFNAGENVLVQPSVLVKSDITKTQTDISCLVRYRENIFAGTSFRGIGTKSKDALVLFGGFKLNERTILAYSFDIPLSALNSVNRGSHEILLRYDLNKTIGAGKLPPVIYNPRFL
jgi:hypothetical protein